MFAIGTKLNSQMVKLNVYLLELESTKHMSFGLQFVVRYFRVFGIIGNNANLVISLVVFSPVLSTGIPIDNLLSSWDPNSGYFLKIL